MNQVQALLQRIHANDNSTAPARLPGFALQVTIATVLFFINMINFLINDASLRWIYLFAAVMFLIALVINIINRAQLKHGFVFAPEGLRYRSKTPIPWAYLTGASVHPNPSSLAGRDVLLYVTPEGMQWVQQNSKRFLRPSKTAPGIDVGSIRNLQPDASAYVLNETIRLYRHRHGLPI